MADYKTKVVKAAAAVLLVLLACTVASRTVYTMLLPQVSRVTIQHRMLDYTHTYRGTFVGGRNAAEVLAKSTWTVTEQLAAEGDTVAEGDALLRIDLTDYQIQMKSMEASLQQKRNTINATNWTGGDRLVLEQELAVMEMQYRQLKNSFPASGVVTATASGTLEQLAGPGMAGAGSVLARIASASASAQVEFDVPATDLERVCGAETSRLCQYVLLGEGKPIRAEQQQAGLSVDSVRDNGAGGFTVTAGLTKEAGVPVGTLATITVSSRSGPYDYVPLSCVFYTAKGPCVYRINQRDTLWGIEDYVEAVEVTVVASDASKAAITGDIDTAGALSATWYAAYPSRTLQDGEAVRVVTG